MTRVAIVLGGIGLHGPSLIRLQLARELLRRGFDVDIVFGTMRTDAEALIPEGCSVHNLRAVRPMQFFWQLRKYLLGRKPDGLLASSWPYSALSIIAAKLSCPLTRVVISEHADFRTSITAGGEFTMKDVWLIRLASRYMYNRADRIVGVSQGVVDGLVAVAGIDSQKATTIHNPLRNMWGLKGLGEDKRNERDVFWASGAIKLLAVGRLVSEKDYSTMLNALAILKPKREYRLLIVGDGALRQTLERQIGDLNLRENVLLVGQTDAVAEYYEKADVFVMSSSSEGFGNVLVEALSFGLPIVSTNCRSGPSEILEAGRYGILTPVGDPTALAEAIEGAATSGFESENQKRRANEFSVEAAADQYISALFPCQCG